MPPDSAASYSIPILHVTRDIINFAPQVISEFKFLSMSLKHAINICYIH